MTGLESTKTVTDFVNELTKGKPYVFVIVQYKENYPFFKTIKSMVNDAVGIACLRADDVHASGHKFHGIVIRGPHPLHPGLIVLIMAGAHSIGTGAACYAATSSSLIRLIQEKLPERDSFTDKSKTIWALVRGNANKQDYLLDENGVSILRAGTYHKP